MDDRDQKRVSFFTSAVVRAPSQASALRSYLSNPSRELAHCLDVLTIKISESGPWEKPEKALSVKMLSIAYKLIQSQDHIFTLAGKFLVWAEEARVVQWHSMEEQGVCLHCKKVNHQECANCCRE